MKHILKLKLLVIVSLIFTFSCSDNQDDSIPRKAALANVIADEGIEAVTLTWDLPAENVKSYIISINPGGKYVALNDGTKKELILKNLTGGVTYTFTISWLDSNLNPSEMVTVAATPEIRPVGTYSGNLLFKNQSELDVFVLAGSAALENILGDLTIQSDASGNIFDLKVLKDLKFIQGKLKIIGNPILSNLDHLSKLTTVGDGIITIQNNRNLYSLCGISSITGTNSVTISGNDFNPTFSEIQAGTCKAPELAYTGTLTRFNTQAEVDALPDGLTSFPGELVIGLTEATNTITNLSKFSKVRKVGGRLLVQFTPGITDLLGLRSLVSIGTNTGVDELVVRSNKTLTTLNGLQALNYVARRVGIRQNPALTTLEGLNNLKTIGDKTITIGICGNATGGNPLLTNFCALDGIINSIGVSQLNPASCIDNYTTFNPTFQNIIDGTCSK